VLCVPAGTGLHSELTRFEEPDELPAALARCAEQLYDYMAVNPAAIPWRLALSAFPHLPALRAHAQQRAAENRAMLGRWLQTTDALAGELPPHGIVTLLKLTREMDAVACSERLRQQRDVLLTPGDFFGAPGHVRLAYGMSPAVFSDALSALGKGLRAADGDQPM
jgi:aspartate/methionine/tyrosine aminotransferase